MIINKNYICLFLVLQGLVVKANSNNYHLDDYDKYRRQGDSLFKVCNYTAAIKKYKSCLVFKEKDEYSLSKLNTIYDITSKLIIASNFNKSDKYSEAIQTYRQILVLNKTDIESIKNLPILLGREYDKSLREGDDDAAILVLEEIITLSNDPNKRTVLQTEIKHLKEKRFDPNYLKIVAEAQSLLKSAKYPEAVQKYKSIFSLTGFSKDKETTKTIEFIDVLQQAKENATKYIDSNNFQGAIVELSKVMNAGINDLKVKRQLLVVLDRESQKLLNEGKKDDATTLLLRGIALYDGDEKNQNVLQKKLYDMMKN